jgi:PAS domain S-box-containing protein
MRAGDCCIVIAVSARLQYLARSLAATPFGGDALAYRGSYLLLDAAELLAQIMREDAPSEQRFVDIVGGIIAGQRRAGRVRIFGEMVALLCAAGRHEAALQLEKMWEALALRHAFTLLCAYPLSGFADEADGVQFRQICGAHNRILPAESFRELPHPEELHRTIAYLQQKAHALESEVMRRKSAEAVLKEREQELTDFLENAMEGLRRIGADGRILWANRVELDLLGYAPQEYIGHHATEFHVDAAVGADLLRRQLRGETVINYPARLRCRDGGIKHVLIHSNALSIAGRFVSVRCFTRDVSDQVQLEQERHLREEDQEAERRLRAAHDELEVRVRERTARLEQSNARLTAEIAERKRAEQALQQSQQLLRELGQHTEEIIEGERKRIARELHDQLGQNLMALRIDVMMMHAEAGEAQAKLAPTVASALDNIDSMIRNVRAIINNLRPAVLDLGLPATIEWEVKEFERRSGIACSLVTDSDEYAQLDDARALALLRILQESLTNVLRHAHASHVDIRLHSADGKLRLRVADDGVGAYPGCRRKTNAYGLLGIQERVSAFGGELAIETGMGKGLALTVTLPLHDDKAAPA